MPARKPRYEDQPIHGVKSRIELTLSSYATTQKVARVSVSDDDVGGADPARGSGLAGWKDRVEAAGGALTVQSRPGEGTRLIAELPAGSGIAAGTAPTRSESLL